jgi:hypothetical protein
VANIDVLIRRSPLSDFRPVTGGLTFLAMLLACLTTALPVFSQVAAEDPVQAESDPAIETPVQAQEARVALAQFTTAIENREPTDHVTFIANDVERVFFYTDLRDLEGQTISHRWLYNGTVMGHVPFEVRGPRWRVWSSKKLIPDLIGDWTVEIVTAEGEVIAAETFTYSAPDA